MQNGNNDLRIGIVGFGLRAGLWREAHKPGQGSVVTAVCDPAARALADAHRELPHATLTRDINELLATGVDAVLVLTPDDQHAAVAIPALEVGVAVFCDKPLATTLADMDAILETARRTGSLLYVGHNMRHMPVIKMMRSLIVEGAIGEVKAIWCRHFVGNGGDYYFKDWHADRRHTTSLLLQKGAHDIDIIHWLAGAPSVKVAAMGDLMIYGDITSRRDRSGERMRDWFSLSNWPPTSLEGLNDIVDVEDISQVNMLLANGALASYQQCHFTPDYWRNYTVIGTEGRLENMGDTTGSYIYLWNKRHNGAAPPDEKYLVTAPTVSDAGHDGADALLIAEFLRFVREGGKTETSPIAARDSVAAGIVATESLRSGGGALPVPQLDADLIAYFDNGQRASSPDMPTSSPSVTDNAIAATKAAGEQR